MSIIYTVQNGHVIGVRDEHDATEKSGKERAEEVLAEAKKQQAGKTKDKQQQPVKRIFLRLAPSAEKSRQGPSENKLEADREREKALQHNRAVYQNRLARAKQEAKERGQVWDDNSVTAKALRTLFDPDQRPAPPVNDMQTIGRRSLGLE